MERKQSEPYISTYLHAKGRKLGLPIAGNFELTPRCNFSCPMCYVHMTDADIARMGRRELTSDEWLRIAGAAKDRGMVFALLTGGEPLVRRDFFDIYGGMKKMGLLVSINSNASMLEGEILERFAADPPFRFNLSLYGAGNDTYEKMCGKPYFDRIVRNIKALKELGIDLRLNVSLTQHNKNDICRIYTIAEELGVHVKAASYMYPAVRLNNAPGESDRMSPEDAARAAVDCDLLRFTEEEFVSRAEGMERGIVEREDCPIEADEGVSCRAGRSSFWMTWDGKMLPCGMMTSPCAYPMEVGFDAAWESIRKATDEIRLPPECSSCSKRGMCSVCAAVCSAESGGFASPPKYVCRMTDEIRRLTAEECAKISTNAKNQGGSDGD